MKIINFMGVRKSFGIVSVVLVISSLVYIALEGIQMNVDFVGGTKLTVAFRSESIDISALRSEVSKVDPKTTIVQETVEGYSQFSLKIKNPDVAKGQESKASLARLRGLKNAFASMNNEDLDVIGKLKDMELALLTAKLAKENIYGLVDTDANKEAAYKALAEKLKSSLETAGSVDALAAAADPDNAKELASDLMTLILPALNQATADVLNATLKKYDPLGRGADAEYSDIAGHVESLRAAGNDFIGSFDDLTFTGVAGEEDAATLSTFFKDNFVLSGYRIVGNETFSPSIAAELLQDAEGAILLALFGILIYIAVRFDANYAVASVAALAHDVIIALGVFALAGTLWGVELSNPVVAAFLTIVGYSLNDTIVVFDRIRDNRADIKNPDLFKIMNESINQTLSRTIVTSLTTFFVVGVIYWGSNNATLQDFAFPLLIGIVVGTYSSIFVASPVLMFLTEHRTFHKLWTAARAFYRVITFASSKKKSASRA